jgi:glucosamine-6-phosphate deaminase
MERAEEIRELLRISEDELIKRAGDRIVVKNKLDDLYQDFSDHLANLIMEHNALKKPTRVIIPVGPTDQYPLLAKRINKDKIDLSRVMFFFMDEYCGPDGKALPAEHPLSLKAAAKRLIFDQLDKRPPYENIIFPDENNINELATLISEAPIDVCYGGIGIHGHVAFNEPEPGVENTGPRRVRINDFSVTISAIRSGVGGDLENFPRQAFTIGMQQILSARTIRLYSRSIPPFDWAKTTLRLALFGEPGWDYPVTYIRECDYLIVADRATVRPPEIIL